MALQDGVSAMKVNVKLTHDMWCQSVNLTRIKIALTGVKKVMSKAPHRGGAFDTDTF